MKTVFASRSAKSISVSNASDRLSNLKTENHIPLATGKPLVILTRPISVE